MFVLSEEIKLKLIILLVYPVGIITTRIIQKYFENNPYFYLFLFYISHYLALFILLFYKMKLKFQNKKVKSTKTDDLSKKDELIKTNESFAIMAGQSIDLIVNENKYFVGYKLLVRLLFIGILYFISYGIFYYSSFIIDTAFDGSISIIA